MGYDMRIESTSGVTVTDEVSEALQEAFDALAKLPSTRAVNLDFPTKAEANYFARQGYAWAAENGLTFVRKAPRGYGKISDLPTRVTFRVYVPAPEDSPRRKPKSK